MNWKYMIAIPLAILLASCANESIEQDGFPIAHQATESTQPSNFPGESTTVNEDQLPTAFDSTLLMGTWVLHDSDLSVIENPYVEEMPESFSIDALSQIGIGRLTAKTEHYTYPFMLNRIDHDKLVLYLHPAVCKCEGLEVRYQKK